MHLFSSISIEFPKGGEKAFKRFFDQYHLLVFKRIYTLIGEFQRSEELTQDIFISLWHNRNSLQAQENWKSYLLRAARNKAIDEWRRKKDHVTFNAELVIVNERDDSESELNEKRMEAILKEIDHLPEKCRMIFKLNRFEQKSYKQIAGELEISEKTVENQIGKALKMIRKNLLFIASPIFSEIFF